MTKDHLNLSTDNAQDSLFSIDDCNEAYQYLQNSANFVSFHTGLTTLMQRCGYTGSSEDVEEKTAYLQQKLAAIHVKITEITVRDWFSGKHRHPSTPEAANSSMKSALPLVLLLSLYRNFSVRFTSAAALTAIP